MQYAKYLRWALLGGLTLLFFIPFIIADGGLFPNMFFPYITGKNFTFRILVELMAGAYVLLAIKEPKYRPRASLLMWAVCAFVVWTGIAVAFSVDPVKSFWSNFERMDGYITVLHIFAYFIILGAMIAAEDWWGWLLRASIISGTLQALYSLGQLLHIGGLSPSSQSGPRLDGTFGNATYLAIFMLFNAFLAILMLIRERRSTTAQALYGIALVLEVAALFYTATRGALLGLIGGLIIAAIYIAWKGTAPEWTGLRKVSLWGLGAIGALIILFFALRTTPIVQKSDTLERLASISLHDPTTDARFMIWGMAYHGFLEHPVLGWGQENFNFVFNKYYNPSMYSQEQWFDRAHNQFLDWLIAGGLPAFLLYISLFVLAAWAILRADALSVPEQAVLFGLLGAYAFNNLFVFTDLMSSVYFFLVLALAHSLSRKPLPGWMFLSKPVGQNGMAIAAPIIIAVTLGGAWMLNAAGIARAQNLLTALVTQVPAQNGGYTAKDPATQVKEFQTAFDKPVWPDTPIGRQEVAEQFLQFAATYAPSSIDPSVKQDIYGGAQAAGLEINKERPHDARLELFMAAFYDSFSQTSKAVDYLNQALADSPNKQQILFELGVSYLNAGQPQQAVTVLKKAFDEAPGYKDARILYAGALYYAGNSAAADALLTQGFGTVIVDDQRLLQIYTNTKQWSRVIAIWQKRIDADSKNSQNYIGMASAYFAAGNTAQTIATLQRAAQVDPTLASQVQSLISQIQSGTLKP